MEGSSTLGLFPEPCYCSHKMKAGAPSDLRLGLYGVRVVRGGGVNRLLLGGSECAVVRPTYNYTSVNSDALLKSIYKCVYQFIFLTAFLYTTVLSNWISARRLVIVLIGMRVSGEAVCRHVP
jgi:hypothetical protein